MIHEVDKALRIMITSAKGGPEGMRISFETPNRRWAEAYDGTPTVNLCLYDVREDSKQRKVGRVPMRNDRGQIVGWRPPPRIYKLSYMGTCWMEDTEKAHEVLGWLLTTLQAIKQIPQSALTGSLALWGLAAMDTAPGDDKKTPLSPVLTSLSGEARPGIDIVITAPVVYPSTDASGIVLEELILDAQGKRGRPFERVQRRMTSGIAELERTRPGAPLTERGRHTETEEEQQLREDDPERRH